MILEAEFFLTKKKFNLDIKFKIDKPEITTIYGPSGSGKSTLLRCVCGLEKAEKARLVVNGNIWQDSTNNFFFPVHLRKIGYVPQKNSLFPHLSVKENLVFGYDRIEKNKRKITYKEIIKWLNIEDLIDRHVYELSGGESQKIAIARALLTNPEILIMDEPLSAIDSKNKKEIMNHIKKLKNDFLIPILYVTHLKEEIDYLSERMIFIDNGKNINS